MIREIKELTIEELRDLMIRYYSWNERTKEQKKELLKEMIKRERMVLKILNEWKEEQENEE